MGDIQEHAPGAASFDTLEHKIVPIVFVPGVMGTRLFLDDGPNWDPDSAGFARWLVASRFDIVRRLNCDFPGFPLRDLSAKVIADLDARPILALHASTSIPPGTSTTRNEFFEKRGWGKVVWSFYDAILLSLEIGLNTDEKGSVLHPVFVHGYDWRTTNRDSGKDLHNTVKKILSEVKGAQQVIVVTHSMGGLVTRSALLDGMLDKVAGVVHTVQPSCGAAVAYRRFQTGANFILDSPQQGASLLDWIPAIGLSEIMGITPLDYAATQSGLRGPLELLPSNDYPDVFLRLELDGLATDNREISQGASSTRFSDLYDVYLLDQPPGLMHDISDLEDFLNTDVSKADLQRLRVNVEKARQFHQRFADPSKDNAHPRTFSVFGSTKRTDSSFDALSKDIILPLNRVTQDQDGDGTVPRASAEFRHARPKTTLLPSRPVEHAGCFQSTDFLNDVLGCVRRLIPFAKG
ncbi:MAG TPA: hypothetical protein VHM70_08365 [Polyangiaceae bacterium]|jgi:pimeloyl-ACP methyl ester carboxylesterase|nr:hypothetical protein [Polyangiaceae bacterium]